MNFPTSGFSIISLDFFVTMKLRPEYTCYTQYAWVSNSKSSVSLFTYISWFLFYGLLLVTYICKCWCLNVYTYCKDIFTENYTHLLFSLFVEDLQKIEWNDDGDGGGGGGGWRNGTMGRQHITLAPHRSRISVLPCTFAALRVALCATVRSFTDLCKFWSTYSIFLMTFLQQFFFHNRVILFGWELVVLHSSPCMFGEFQCMLGISVEVWMKNILYRIVEGQTHFGMQWRGAKISLALNESN